MSAELCCVSLLACAADPQQHGPACWVRCGAIQCGQCNQADQRAAARMCRRLPGASLLGGPWSVRRAAEPRAELASGGARSRRRSTRRRGGPLAARLGEDMPAMVAAASRACALQGGGCRRGCGRQRAAGSNGLQRLTGHTEARLRTAEQNVTVGRRRRYVKLPASGSAAGPQADLVAVALSYGAMLRWRLVLTKECRGRAQAAASGSPPGQDADAHAHQRPAREDRAVDGRGGRAAGGVAGQAGQPARAQPYPYPTAGPRRAAPRSRGRASRSRARPSARTDSVAARVEQNRCGF